MKICFITVNYNNSKLTKEYIWSIKKIIKNEEDRIDTIVIDNDSIFKEKIILKEINEKNLKIIFNEKNLGYFQGLNIGLKEIQGKEYEYIIISNNDIIFEKDFLIKLKESKYDEDTLVICPNLKTKDNIHQNPMQKKRYSKFYKFKSDIYFFNYILTNFILKLINLFRKKRKNENIYWKESDYIWIGIGACYILVNNFRNYIPLLDNRVFLWGEEALFANQIHSLDKKVYYDSNIKAIHLESASVSKMPSKTKYNMIKQSYKIYRKYL